MRTKDKAKKQRITKSGKENKVKIRSNLEIITDIKVKESMKRNRTRKKIKGKNGRKIYYKTLENLPEKNMCPANLRKYHDPKLTVPKKRKGQKRSLRTTREEVKYL